jgi:hypothetical protein
MPGDTGQANAGKTNTKGMAGSSASVTPMTGPEMLARRQSFRSDDGAEASRLSPGHLEQARW